MSNSRNIGSVNKVAITILVDNKADLIVRSSDRVKYFTDKPLLAEHGFSAMVQTDDADERILWDAGVSQVALMENMRRMELDFQAVATIALSHGHFDHYAAMTTFLDEMDLTPKRKEWGKTVNQETVEDYIAASQIPIVAHPAAFRERWWRKDDGTLIGPVTPPPALAWQAAGARIVHASEPYQLAAGCWTTGYVPRKSFEKTGRPTKLLYRQGADLLPDDIDEDQAIVINVKGKGLVVLSGCAHSGIMNTVKHAQAFTGVDSIYAVIGGFHLARADDDEIRKTIDFVKSVNPTFIMPSHCTGFKAMCQFAQEMPDAFVEGVVGLTFHL